MLDVQPDNTTAAPVRVMLFRDGEPDIGDAMASGFRDAGCAVTVRPRWQTPIAADELAAHDIAVAYGPHNGSMMAVAESLQRCTPARRPFFIWWLSENSPNLDRSAWWLYLTSWLRFNADRVLGHPVTCTKNWTLPLPLRVARRARVLGELRHFQRRGLIDMLAVTASARHAWLAHRGFNPVHAPLGHDDIFGRDLNIERDLDVVYLGQPPRDRRAAILKRVGEALARHGVTLTIQHGQDGYLNGEQRTQYLNRASILLNVMNHPSDWNGHRLLVGMSCKALVVSEPIVHDAPFRAGEHYVAATGDNMAAAVLHYLKDEAARRRIVDAAYHYLTGELTMAHACRRLLAEASRRRPAAAPLADPPQPPANPDAACAAASHA